MTELSFPGALNETDELDRIMSATYRKHVGQSFKKLMVSGNWPAKTVI